MIFETNLTNQLMCLVSWYFSDSSFYPTIPMSDPPHFKSQLKFANFLEMAESEVTYNLLRKTADRGKQKDNQVMKFRRLKEIALLKKRGHAKLFECTALKLVRNHFSIWRLSA